MSTDSDSASTGSLFADLPAALQEMVLAHPDVDARGRLALFQGSHTLAQNVVLHAGKRTLKVTHGVRWTPGLARLFTRWPFCTTRSWHLHVSGDDTSSSPAPIPTTTLPEPPPAAVSRHVSHLQLSRLALGAPGLSAWRLHDAGLWPALRDLTVHDCAPAGTPPPSDNNDNNAVAQPPQEAQHHLQPILALHSLSLTATTDAALDRWAGPGWQLLQELASGARQLRVQGEPGSARTLRLPAVAVRTLPHLASVRLPGRVPGDVEAMLTEHPCLEHVELGYWYDLGFDRSQQACRCKSVTLLQDVGLSELALRPLANLQRLAVHGGLYIASVPCMFGMMGSGTSGGGGGSGLLVERGMAALQQLHERRRLALLPASRGGLGGGSWQLEEGEGLFSVHTGREQHLLVPLLRLAVEAGEGVTALRVDWARPPAPLGVLRHEAAPLLRRSGGRVRALCLEVWGSTPVEWCEALLGALQGCVARVHVRVEGGAAEQVRALVRGGVSAAVAHPLALTVIHNGCISSQQEAELHSLLLDRVREEDGCVAAPQPSLLSLKVVTTCSRWSQK